ncbi:MAG: VWA domain-containing protein [Planctomycetota bacterium]|nr:VWA domain-containing protein [Planctomycetota bacterium]
MTLSVCCQRLLLLAYCLSATLPAQKPRSSEAALANFTKVEDKPEADRRRAVRDLGPYAEPAVTELLLRELQTAKELGYRQDLVKAIGGSVRPLAVETLAPLLRRETNLYLQDLIAISIAKQGEEGIAVLTTELIAQRNNRSQRISLLNALGQSELRTARNAVLHELRTAAGRDRLPALRALKDVVSDVDIDELRVQLARDNDIEMACAALLQLDQHKHPMAGACALDLHKRGKPLDAQAHAAVLQGFLIKPIAEYLPLILLHGARADDPFGKKVEPAWAAALANDAVARFLVSDAAVPKDPLARAFLAECLGRLGGDPARTALGKLLHEPGPVRDAAAAGLVRIGDLQAQALLTELQKTGNDEARAIALAALYELRFADPAFGEVLLLAAFSPMPQLQAVALRLLAERRPTLALALPPALTAIENKNLSVRAAAVQLLAALRHKDAIPVLINRLDKEQGRLRSDLLAALLDLTQLSLLEQQQWLTWWQQNGKNFAVPPPKDLPKPSAKATGGTVATYWNLQVSSERVVFVLDISGSMLEQFGTGGKTRLEAAKTQLERVVPLLPQKGRCNLIWFGSEAQAFSARLVDQKQRAALQTAARDLVSRGATNVFAALELAFTDPEVDTIYLLTDGYPSAGTIVDGNQLADEVRRWNRLRGIRIHTIALGGKSDFLERLAKDSGGDSIVAR